jgi:hypothetical protein
MYVRRCALVNGGAHERIRRSSARTTRFVRTDRRKNSSTLGSSKTGTRTKQPPRSCASHLLSPWEELSGGAAKVGTIGIIPPKPPATFHRLMLVSKRGSSERASNRHDDEEVTATMCGAAVLAPLSPLCLLERSAGVSNIVITHTPRNNAGHQLRPLSSPVGSPIHFLREQDKQTGYNYLGLHMHSFILAVVKYST